MCTWFVVAAALLWRASAFNILSERVNIYSINGQLRQNKTVSIQCTDGDFDVPQQHVVHGADGVDHTVEFTCRRPKRNYLWSPLGYGPSRGKIYTGIVDLVADPSSYNNSAARAVEQGRQLLGFWDDVGDVFQTVACHAGGIVPVLGGAVELGMALGGKCGGGGEPSEAEMAQMRADNTARDTALTNLRTSQTTWNNEATRQLALDQERFRTVERHQEATNTALTAAQTMLGATRNNLAQFQASTTRDVNALRAQQIQTNIEIANNLAIMNQVVTGEAALKAASISLGEGLNTVSAQLSNLSIASANAQAVSATRDRAASKRILTISQSLLSIARQDQLRRMMTYNLHTILNQVHAESVYTAFLAEENSPAAPNAYNLGVFSSIVMGVYRLRYFSQFTDSTLRGTVTELTYTVSSVFLVRQHLLVVDFMDIMDMFGPVGCTTTEGPTQCRTWITVTDRFCNMPGNTVPGTWAGSDDLSYTDPNTQAVINQCSPGAPAVYPTLNGGIDGTIITSQAQFMSVMRTLGLRSTHPTQTGYTMLQKPFPKTTANIPERVGMITGDIPSLLEPVDGAISIMFVLAEEMKAAYQFTLSNSLEYDRLIDGQLPQTTTWRHNLLAVDSAGQAVARHTASFAAFDLASLVPIGQLTPTSTETNFDVTIDGSTHVTSDVTVGTTWSHLIPGVELIMGNPFLQTAGTRIFNLAQEELSASENPEMRSGTYTYAMIRDQQIPNDVSRFNPAAWVLENGDDFDHMAAVTPDRYARVLDANGLCTGPDVGSGEWCTRRQHFIVTANEVGSLLTLSDRDGYSIIANVIVPEGEIVALRSSACPTFTISIESGNAVSVTYTNALNTASTVVLQQTGGCPSTRSISIPARGAFLQIVPLCQTTPAGQTETIHILYDAGGPSLTECPNTVNVTLTPQFALNFEGQISSRFAQQLTTSAVDQALLNVQRVVDELTGVLAKTVVFATTIPTYAAIYVAPQLYSNSTILLEEIAAARARVLGALTEQRAAGLVNYTHDAEPYVAAYEAAAVVLNASIAAAKENTAVLAAQNIQGQTFLTELQNQTNITNYAWAEFARTDKIFMGRIVDAFQKLADARGQNFLEFLEDFGEWVADAATSAYKAVANVINGTGGCSFPMGIICAGKSIFTDLLNYLLFGALTIGLAVGLYYLIRWLIQRRRLQAEKEATEARDKKKDEQHDTELAEAKRDREAETEHLVRKTTEQKTEARFAILGVRPGPTDF